MPFLILGIVAIFILLVVRQLRILTSSPSSTDRFHRDTSSEYREHSQHTSADVSCLTDRIEFSRIELHPGILPPTFVVLDLETTGLNPAQHEIIEVAAIRVVGRNLEIESTFRTFVKPTKRIPRMITRINGISQAIVDSEGIPLVDAIKQFSVFVQDVPLVSFNADFDMAFLRNAAHRNGLTITNPTFCALRMARLALPDRESYKLSDLAKDTGLSRVGMHHALFDCKLALVVYVAAASILGTTSMEEAAPEVPVISRRMQTFRQTSRIPSDPVDRNLLGMELEANGEIDSAIECYEANVHDGFDGNHPYDRLAIIFRRLKDRQSEVAVLGQAVEVFSKLQSFQRPDVPPKLEKFKQRLSRASSLLQKEHSHAISAII